MPAIEDQLDLAALSDEQDIGPTVAGLIASAVEEGSTLTLSQVHQAVQAAQCAKHLDALSSIPLLLSCPDPAAASLLDAIGAHASPKEVVMAVQEAAERLGNMLRSFHNDEDVDEEDIPGLSPVERLVRLINIYSLSIPRLSKGKKLPHEVLRPLMSELKSLISLAGHSTNAEYSRNLVQATSRLLNDISAWIGAGEKRDSAEIMYSVMNATLESCANRINIGLASQAFEKQFPRLVMPRDSGARTPGTTDSVHDALDALAELGFTVSTFKARPSLGSIILIAHSTSSDMDPQALALFLPAFLASMQSNAALDETLSILLTSFGPLHGTSPRPELPPNLIVPLVQILSPLASAHPDPSTRHIVFRLLSMVLALAPSSLRLQLLKDLLTNPDTSSPQMHVAAVGLVKEAALDSLASPVGSPNVFASPLFIQVFGPMVFSPQPAELFQDGKLSLKEFLESPEPLRLVEVLGLLYVLLQRDVGNRTGVRDLDVLRNFERVLLGPLQSQLRSWTREADNSANHDAALQMGILDMWTQRVLSAIAAIKTPSIQLHPA